MGEKEEEEVVVVAGGVVLMVLMVDEHLAKRLDRVVAKMRWKRGTQMGSSGENPSEQNYCFGEENGREGGKKQRKPLKWGKMQREKHRIVRDWNEAGLKGVSSRGIPSLPVHQEYRAT